LVANASGIFCLTAKFSALETFHQPGRAYNPLRLVSSCIAVGFLDLSPEGLVLSLSNSAANSRVCFQKVLKFLKSKETLYGVYSTLRSIHDLFIVSFVFYFAG
jgi:hypothetical protein